MTRSAALQTERPGLTVLVVDDNPDDLTTLKAVIRHHFPASSVLLASNGQQALDLARSRQVDVILLDIVMPSMDGYAVCRELKADKRLLEIPVLFVTAIKTDRDSRIRAMEAGAEVFLAKPLDGFELAAQLVAMVRLRGARRGRRQEKDDLTAMVAERTRELDQELAARTRAEAALAEQLSELRRWHSAMLGREGRVIELKREVNELLAQLGREPRYPSVASGGEP